MPTTLERPDPAPRPAPPPPPALPAPPVPWRGRDTAAMAGIGLLSVMLLMLAGFVIGWDFQEFTSNRAAVVLLLNGTIPALLAYAYLWLRFRPEHRYVWRPGGTAAPRWAPALGIGLGLGVAWYVVVDLLGVAAVVGLTGYEPPEVQQEISQALTSPGAAQVATWLAVVVIAPLAEELIFRGVLFLGLARWIGPIPAALISSLVFGLVHLQGDLAATAFMTLYAVPFGLFACWLLHRYGSLWLPIGVHAGSNGATLAVATAASSFA